MTVMSIRQYTAGHHLSAASAKSNVYVPYHTKYHFVSSQESAEATATSRRRRTVGRGVRAGGCHNTLRITAQSINDGQRRGARHRDVGGLPLCVCVVTDDDGDAHAVRHRSVLYAVA